MRTSPFNLDIWGLFLQQKFLLHPHHALYSYCNSADLFELALIECADSDIALNGQVGGI